MLRITLAAVAATLATGATLAQEAPYTVRNGQVLYPGQQQWRAPTYGYGYGYGYDAYAPSYYDGERYRGDAYAAFPRERYVEPGYFAEPFYDGGRDYPYRAPGAYVFDGLNVNQDDNYSGR